MEVFDTFCDEGMKNILPSACYNLSESHHGGHKIHTSRGPIVMAAIQGSHDEGKWKLSTKYKGEIYKHPMAEIETATRAFKTLCLCRAT